MPIRKPKPKVVSTPPVAIGPSPEIAALSARLRGTTAAAPIAAETKPAEKFRMIHTRLTMRQWRQVADQARDDDTSVQALVVDALRAHLAKRGIALE